MNTATKKIITDKVSCPTCGAGPGWPCKSVSAYGDVKPLPMQRNHRRRVLIVVTDETAVR